jgi:hypothetical protein
MENTVRYVVTSQLCDSVLPVAVFVELFLIIHPPLRGVAGGWNREILLKIHNFTPPQKM